MIIPGFKDGDRVRVIDDADGPIPHGPMPRVGSEYVLDATTKFDEGDNSWSLDGMWVYETSLELVEPALSDDEVAKAIASLKGDE